MGAGQDQNTPLVVKYRVPQLKSYSTKEGMHFGWYRFNVQVSGETKGGLKVTSNTVEINVSAL
jgi:hypothetical protein